MDKELILVIRLALTKEGQQAMSHQNWSAAQKLAVDMRDALAKDKFHFKGVDVEIRKR